jgi:hypothetical protein
VGAFDDDLTYSGGMFSGPPPGPVGPDQFPSLTPQPAGDVGRPWVGHIVLLPDGSPIPDPTQDGAYVRSPMPDLSLVAAAGRQTGDTYRLLSADPDTLAGAELYKASRLGVHLAHGGTFDYQREGNSLTGFTQYPQFRSVSNVNVGLYCQQAGMTLDETLATAGQFAGLRSSNAKPNQPYGLDAKTAAWIKKGFEIGQSGAFDPRQVR